MIIFPLFSISVGIAIRQITAQITSVVPFNNITCRHRVLTTAIIWIPAVHTIHPTTPASSIEFIEVINTLNILAAISSAVLHLELISIPDTAEQIKDCLTLLKLHGNNRKDTAAGWDDACPLRILCHAICHCSITADRKGHRILFHRWCVLI